MLRLICLLLQPVVLCRFTLTHLMLTAKLWENWISWLLIIWLLASVGHQQHWYWLCRVGMFLCLLSINTLYSMNDRKLEIYSHLSWNKGLRCVLIPIQLCIYPCVYEFNIKPSHMLWGWIWKLSMALWIICSRCEYKTFGISEIWVINSYLKDNTLAWQLLEWSYQP